MLADILYSIFPYQIFRSVLFRGGMGYITSYFLVNWFMPQVIVFFRKRGYYSDMRGSDEKKTPIMGGSLLLGAVLFSTILWVWFNIYIIFLLIFFLSFGFLGFVDDMAKILNQRKIQQGTQEKRNYMEKADGISGGIRLFLEIFITGSILCVFLYYFKIDTVKIQIPMIPIKNFYPEIPSYLYFFVSLFIIVGGANAVNLADGLDSLATVPLLTCLFFVAAAAYITGDSEWSERLKIAYISESMKEISILAFILIGSCMAFLRFNSPPASIYMGDIGSLSLGSIICAMFVFVKVELYLPIVGWIFFISAFSSIIQRVWFFCALRLKGREYAKKNRFFYKAPYHHHQQITISTKTKEVHSIFHQFIKKFRRKSTQRLFQYQTSEDIKSKVIWFNHIKSIWLLVIALIIYLKVR